MSKWLLEDQLFSRLCGIVKTAEAPSARYWEFLRGTRKATVKQHRS